MSKDGFLIFFLTTFMFLTAIAGPARPGVLSLTQPDGTTFNAIFAGDEWMKVKTTEDGSAIVQEKDGWWYIAVYEGSVKVSTGYRVGDVIPSGIIAQSKNIPYGLLRQNAHYKRMQVSRMQAEDRSALTKSSAVDDSGTEKRGLIILAEFKGLKEKFTHSRDEFVNMLTQEGYSEYGATGSAKEYFEDQFSGKYTFRFDVSDIVTLPKNIAYYGENDSNTDQDARAHEMIVDACKLLDDAIDFSVYDQDGDGEVDNVFLFFAGNDEAEGTDSDNVWSHAWYVYSGAGVRLSLDGVRINRYACASELTIRRGHNYMASIGTFCHEYCHTFGIPDMYDTDYNAGGFAAGTWRVNSLMDAGNYNNDGNTPPNLNAVEREYIGLSEPVVIDKPGTYELNPISTGQFYRINTDNEGEYFLLECRQKEGWDAYLYGEGMLVYHIDRSDKDSGYSEVLEKNISATKRWSDTNEVNARADHQCADLIEADGRRDSFDDDGDSEYRTLYSNQSGLFFPYSLVNTLLPSSVPGLQCWDGASLNLGLTEIAFNSGKVSFKVNNYVKALNIRVDVFQTDAILSFESEGAYEGDATVSYGLTDGSKQTFSVPAYAPGKWAVVLPDLIPSSSYKVSVSFADGNGGTGIVQEKSFLSKKASTSSLPYIYMETIARTPSMKFLPGTKLPLRLFNASEAVEVKWLYDDAEITTGEDCYYTVEKSGVLKAVVTWKDGSEEVIMKEIKISEM